MFIERFSSCSPWVMAAGSMAGPPRGWRLLPLVQAAPAGNRCAVGEGVVRKVRGGVFWTRTLRQRPDTDTL